MQARQGFSFQWLDRRIVEIIGTIPFSADRWSRRWLGLGLLAGGATILVGLFVRGRPGWVATIAFLVAELIALFLYFGTLILQAWKERGPSRSGYASELDRDYVQFLGLVRDMVEVGQIELGRLARFVAYRKSSFGYRLGFLTGGLDRLGVLPVLVVLYIQFKDWRFGDWSALQNVNLVGGLLLWALLLIYLSGWWLLRFALRLDLYGYLLDEALAHTHADDAWADRARCGR